MQSESKREEFRRYLEGTGVLDALTKVLVGLYEEPDKPSDALEYPPVYCYSTYMHVLVTVYFLSLYCLYVY